MRDQVVANHGDSLCLGKSGMINEPLDIARPIQCFLGGVDVNLSPLAQRLDEHERVTHAVANVFIINFCGVAGTHR